MTTSTRKIITTAMLALGLTTSHVAAEEVVPQERIQTFANLKDACKDFSNDDSKRTCVVNIAQETLNFASDYNKGLKASFTSSQFIVAGIVQKELAENCSISEELATTVKTSKIDDAITAVSHYSGQCFSRIIDAQSGEYETLFGDTKADFSNIPFDGNRMTIIDSFRVVAVGLHFPNSSLRVNDEPTFQESLRALQSQNTFVIR